VKDRFALQSGLLNHVVNEAKDLVEEHLQALIDAWNEHFSG